jgi:hypothetical protein
MGWVLLPIATSPWSLQWTSPAKIWSGFALATSGAGGHWCCNANTECQYRKFKWLLPQHSKAGNVRVSMMSVLLHIWVSSFLWLEIADLATSNWSGACISLKITVWAITISNKVCVVMIHLQFRSAWNMFCPQCYTIVKIKLIFFSNYILCFC